MLEKPLVFVVSGDLFDFGGDFVEVAEFVPFQLGHDGHILQLEQESSLALEENLRKRSQLEVLVLYVDH